MQEKPPHKFFRWVWFLDRIQFWHKDELVHRRYADAARSLAVPKDHSIWKKVRTEEADYKGAHSDIVEFFKAFQKACHKRNIPLRAFEFVRTAERQQELYEKGFTKAQAGFGAHQYGMAVDCIVAHKAWSLSKKEWACLIAIGKEVARRRNIKIDSGYDWDFWDPAHWELEGWKEMIAPKQPNKPYKKNKFYDIKTGKLHEIE